MISASLARSSALRALACSSMLFSEGDIARLTICNFSSLFCFNPKKLAVLNPVGGSVQDKDNALLSEIIAKLNDLFTGDLSEGDKVTTCVR
jgi:hypothetical protein